jgi:hypothetical protein
MQIINGCQQFYDQCSLSVEYIYHVKRMEKQFDILG